MTANELKEFSKEMSDLYQQGKIPAPIHLSGGSEEKLIGIFEKYYAPQDWIFSTHRSHYHWLLSGRSKDVLKEKILAGKSMHLFDDKFFTSAIVAGACPIAVGVALALKRKGIKKTNVWCFIGDMAVRTGLFNECLHYSKHHDLPIVFVNEDNKYSVNTETELMLTDKYLHYKYSREYPHAQGIEGKIIENSEYYKAIKEEMTKLGKLDNTIFLGQGVKEGNACNMLTEVPDEKKIEMPVAEELQMGMSIGLSLMDYLPISIYPRMDFLCRATDQIINHLNLIQRLSDNLFNPKVIIKTSIGLNNTGWQHSKDLYLLFKEMCHFPVYELYEIADIKESYSDISENKMLIERQCKYAK